MTIRTYRGRSLVTWLAFACVLALVVTAGLWLVFRASTGTTLSAYFGKTVGLYAGSSVRVLGVPVGQVTDVTPQGDAVRVDMRVDDVSLPAGVGAVVVAPSLVSDRYVQLTPAYDSGPTLATGTVLPRDRTATPVELDDLYSSLDKLSTALGPNGANKDGALSGVLDTAANTLKGNGASLNSTVGQLAGLAKTLDGSKDDLFSTVQNLNSFTGALSAERPAAQRVLRPRRRRQPVPRRRTPRTSARPCSRSAARSATSSSSSTTTRPRWSPMWTSWRRCRRCWSTSGRRSPRCSTSRRPARPTSSTPTTRRRAPSPCATTSTS